MSITVGLRLEPLDVLFFRDGRPFTPASRGKSELPMPQTLAGAIWTAVLQQQGCDFAALRRLVCQEKRSLADSLRDLCGADWLASLHVRGPWFARGRDGQMEVLVPVPAVLQRAKSLPRAGPLLFRLSPRRREQLPGWAQSLLPDQRDLWPLWHQRPGASEPASGFLTREGLRSFLAEGEVSPDEVVQDADVYAFDHRTGIGIHADRLAAQEGLLYGASFLALKPDVVLYAEVVALRSEEAELLQKIRLLALGGEGRRVCVSPLPQPYDWGAIERPLANRQEKPLALLTTPALLASRWKPDLAATQVLAAAVPGHVAVSGWDLARGGPKPARFAAPAGSVYYFDKNPETWPAALSTDPEDQRQGWGCYLRGVWNG